MHLLVQILIFIYHFSFLFIKKFEFFSDNMIILRAFYFYAEGTCFYFKNKFLLRINLWKSFIFFDEILESIRFLETITKQRGKRIFVLKAFAKIWAIQPPLQLL